ncbi:MAG: S49 family peptidase [Rhodocyclaceae bacterium]|nr:S49 family peptidase [Rhodocyclaceae bacterium]
MSEENWERKTIEKLAMAALIEQRRARRWGIFFKLLGFAYLFLLLAALVDWEDLASGAERRHSALVDIHGVIEAQGDANADDVISALAAAFENPHSVGVIVRINSPGGSPVQAGIIHDEMRRLRAKYPDKPLYVVVEDICASGGYYVAAAADQIYVNKASILGSIGVLMNGFGFTGAMDKLGVERRLLTAGEHKGFLDPFSPQNDKHRAHAQGMLEEIHRQFIAVVREGRGKRLRETPEMFSGLMWTGEKSVELGLADGFGTVDSVARDLLKAEHVRDYTVKPNLAEKFARRIGAGMAEKFSALSGFILR